MPDYSKLIDAEVWDFIHETERWYPPDAHTRTVEEQRRIYDAMCGVFFAGHPEGVTAQDRDANGVPVRHYRSTQPSTGVTVLFAHGGSYVLGGLDSHSDVCAEICSATGFDVVAVDYRLLPENSRDDALDDFKIALDWLRVKQGGKVIAVGDSAGAFISASIAHADKGRDIIGQVLIYPALGAMKDGGSMDEHANAPLLSKAEVMAAKEAFGTLSASNATKYPVPLSDPDLTGLPTTITMAAECDPVADHSIQYAAKINAAGGTAICFNDKGLVHGHLRARHRSRRARASFDRVLRAIALIGEGGEISKAAIEAVSNDA